MACALGVEGVGEAACVGVPLGVPLALRGGVARAEGKKVGVGVGLAIGEPVPLAACQCRWRSGC